MKTINVQRQKRMVREVIPISAFCVGVTACFLLVGCRQQSASTDSCCETNTPGTALLTEAMTTAEVSRDRMFAGDWKQPGERPTLSLAHKLTRHDGAEVELKELLGQPIAVSFAYTRCMNPNKCRLVTTTMGSLRKQVQAAGLLEKVKLVLITYDAQYDTPKVMREYAARQGLELDERAMYLRPPVDPENRLFRDLKVNASFNPSGVTMHGIQLLLIDKAGRLARTYRTLIWDNDQVIKELAQLADE